MTNVKDVAKLANVSTATVSRVLTNTGNVSEANTKKVMDAVKQLKYYPNSIGRQLRKMETKTILVVVPDITNSFFSNILRGIENSAVTQGYQVLLGDTQNKTADDFFKYLYEKQVDGIILLTSKISVEELKEAFDTFPIIQVCETIPELDIPTVSINNIKAAEEVTKYLIDRGHKKIVHVTGPLDGILGQNRLQGFKNAMEQNNLNILSNGIIEGDFSLEAGYRIGEEILKLKDRPTAVFAANDEMAIGIMKTFKKHNFLVPEDISVIGFDDIKAAEIVDPELSTFAQPNYQMGEKAMELMLNILNKDIEKVDSIVLNGKLQIRESVSNI